MHISVIGNIGCGKSTLLSSLQDKGIHVEFEPVKEWTLLTKFYNDMKRWAFAFQMEVLHSFSKINTTSRCTIVERSVWESFYIFAQNLRNTQCLTDEEFTLCEKMHDKFGSIPDVFIYLKTSPETCFERIKKRNRLAEEKISLEYIQNLHTLYEYETNLLTKYKKMITINAEQSDKIVLSQIMDQLKSLNVLDTDTIQKRIEELNTTSETDQSLNIESDTFQKRLKELQIKTTHDSYNHVLKRVQQLENHSC